MNMIKSFFQAHQVGVIFESEMHRQDILRKEIAAAKGIFGPKKEDSVRDFFCVDRHTWLWYEEWRGSDGQRKRMTTRFDVRDGRVMKSQNGGEYRDVTDRELKNFKDSVVAYYAAVKKSLYEPLL